jgi:uncharacterized membrane protein YfcA
VRGRTPVLQQASEDDILDLTSIAILFGTGLVAGTINVIAGGGSMLTLPVLIFLGLPATVANGTNRVAILLQTTGATWSFHRRGLISWPWLRLALPPTLVGVALGTWMAVRVGDLAFQRILSLVLVAAAVWTLWHPIEAPHEGSADPPRGRARLGFVGVFGLMGIYGGFIQAGFGFMLLAVTAAFGLDLIRGNAIKAAIVLLYTPLALGIFARNGMVDWPLGLALATGNVTGAFLGVHLQVLKGQAWVRHVVTVTIVLFAARLLFAG